MEPNAAAVMTQLHTSTTSNAKIASSMEGRFRFFDHKKRRSHDHEGHFRRVQGRMRQDLRRCGQIWEVLILLAHGTGRTSGGYVHGCTIRNGPCWAASFNPVIIPSNCHKNEERPVLGRYVVFATSLPVSGPADEILIGVPADYRRRGWGIQTGYRQTEQLRAKTTGQSRGILLPVFFASVFAYNMWAIERNRKNGIGCRNRDFTLLVVAGELAEAAKRRLPVCGSPGPP